MAVKTKMQKQKLLPASFGELVRLMPPMAIGDDVHHSNTVEMIDRLMQIQKLSRGQSQYMETLVELVEAYEARCHAIDLSRLGPARMLAHVLAEADMSASDLARLLKVHPTMGSKILQGQRQLTWGHAKILATHFKISPSYFME